MKVFMILFAVLFGTQLMEAREFRDLTSTDGKTINAELLDLQEGLVKIRVRGKVFEVPVGKLIEADQTFLTEWDLKRKGEEETLYYSELIFEDDFSGEGFGEKWGHYKSESVIQDGVLIGKTIDINDHAGVDSIRFEGKKDMEVSVKFKFAGPEAQRFNVWFDDKDYTGSHAGHVASIAISPAGGSITDAKTGSMENSIYEKKKSGAGLDAETTALLEEKTVRFELEIEQGDWHELLIRTKDETIVVSVDGEEVGELVSEGNAHPTKSLVSLTTNANDVHYDDFVVKAAPAVESEEKE